MALSFIAQPPTPHPAYNPSVWFIDSTNKNLPGFRYIVQIYTSSTAALLAEFKVAPRPGDGYGYIDVSKILQSQVLNDLELANITSYDADDSSVYRYDIHFGEEYIDQWPFSDYQFAAGNFVDLTNFALTPHPYIVGDQIAVTLNAVYNNYLDNINGYYTVTAVPNAFTVTVNNTFPGVGPVTPGVTSFADGRKVRVLSLLVKFGRNAFNRAYSFESFQSYSPLTVLPNQPGTEILNNAPGTGFKCKDYQYLFWNFYDNNTDFIDEVRFVNDAGEVFFKSTPAVPPLSTTIKGVSVGPGNLGVLTPIGPAVLPLIKPNTLYYDVFGYSTAFGAATTLSKRVYIDRICPINETQLLFMDRAGSWSSFAFSLRQRTNQTITRDDWRAELGDLGGGGVTNQWGYELSDAGLRTSSVTLEERYTLGTDFMTDEMSVYFSELITSPELYMQLETAGPWRRVIITDNGYEIQRTKNKRLIRNTVTVRLAVDDNINI